MKNEFDKKRWSEKCEICGDFFTPRGIITHIAVKHKENKNIKYKTYKPRSSLAI
jgi:hypothetical protein